MPAGGKLYEGLLPNHKSKSGNSADLRQHASLPFSNTFRAPSQQQSPAIASRLKLLGFNTLSALQYGLAPAGPQHASAAEIFSASSRRLFLSEPCPGGLDRQSTFSPGCSYHLLPWESANIRMRPSRSGAICAYSVSPEKPSHAVLAGMAAGRSGTETPSRPNSECCRLGRGCGCWVARRGAPGCRCWKAANGL